MAVQIAEKLMTADDLLAMADDGRGLEHELIRGRLIEMPRPGGRHGKLAGKVSFSLTLFAKEHGSEVVVESGFLLERNPDTVRAPDVAYLRPEHAHQADNPKFIDVPPTIAVEINSPNDVFSEMVDKARWWLSKGVHQVWVVDPPTQTVTVYFPDGAARVHGSQETLDAGDAMPGFQLPLSDVFASPTSSG